MHCFRFLVFIGWWLLATATCTASSPNTAAIVIRTLPADGLLLGEGWRYHAGDDPAWARPNFDDSRWDTLSPARPRQVQPHAVQIFAGCGCAFGSATACAYVHRCCWPAIWGYRY